MVVGGQGCRYTLVLTQGGRGKVVGEGERERDRERGREREREREGEGGEEEKEKVNKIKTKRSGVRGQRKSKICTRGV